MHSRAQSPAPTASSRCASDIADAQDPEVLAKLTVFATSVLVGEGETQTVALKLIKR